MKFAFNHLYGEACESRPWLSLGRFYGALELNRPPPESRRKSSPTDSQLDLPPEI
jgi:hypothetical protein